jgi:hypothetical protein
MKIYVDRNTITPSDLKITDEYGAHNVEWLPITGPRTQLNDPGALAQAIVGGIRGMQNGEPGSSSIIHMVKEVRLITGWDLRESKSFCDVFRDHFDPGWRARQ